MGEKVVKKHNKVLLRIEDNILPLVDLVAKKRQKSRTSIINLAISYWLGEQKHQIKQELKACEKVLHQCK